MKIGVHLPKLSQKLGRVPAFIGPPCMYVCACLFVRRRTSANYLWLLAVVDRSSDVSAISYVLQGL